METIRSLGSDGRRPRAGLAPNPRNRSRLSTAPRQTGPEEPPPTPALEAKTGPLPAGPAQHGRHKSPSPPGPTAGAARFRKKSRTRKTEHCRDLRRETRPFFGRGVGVFVNLKHPVSRGE